MAYNRTKKEKDDAIMRDTRKKIEREAIIGLALIKKYFKPISKSAFSHYSKFGMFPNLQTHNDNLDLILNSQYAGTAQQFIRQVRDALGELEGASEINLLINNATAIQQSLDILTTSTSIIETTKKDMDRSIRDVIVGAAFAGVTLSDRKVAKMAKKKFDALSNSRVEGISMTQTQQAAEGAKHTELGTLIRTNAVFTIAKVALGVDTIKKTWMAVMDNRVRRAHADAESQVVNFNEPYVVGGQLLMYPGDSSLGASLNNIINCRCASIKTIIRAN